VDLPSSSGQEAQSSDDDEDAEDKPSVLIGAVTTRGGEVHSGSMSKPGRSGVVRGAGGG
jgi:hypothetical protein